MSGSVAFSTFAELCSRHLCPVPKHRHRRLKQPSPRPPPPAPPPAGSLWIRLFWTSHVSGIPQHVTVCVWLLALRTVVVTFIRAVAWNSAPFLSVAGNIPRHGPAVSVWPGPRRWMRVVNRGCDRGRACSSHALLRTTCRSPTWRFAIPASGPLHRPVYPGAPLPLVPLPTLQGSATCHLLQGAFLLCLDGGGGGWSPPGRLPSGAPSSGQPLCRWLQWLLRLSSLTRGGCDGCDHGCLLGPRGGWGAR